MAVYHRESRRRDRTGQMTQEYVYHLHYECGGCNGPITCLIPSVNPNVPESSAKVAASQKEVWCEDSDCNWHGPAGGLKYIRMSVGTWMAGGPAPRAHASRKLAARLAESFRHRN